MIRYRLYEVQIKAHKVDRWSIPEQERALYASDERKARTDAIRRAHIDAEVPPLLSLMRLSWQYSSATLQPEVIGK